MLMATEKPFKITVYSSEGQIRYTAYGANLRTAATELVSLFKLQHPNGQIYDMTAPFQNVSKVW